MFAISYAFSFINFKGKLRGYKILHSILVRRFLAEHITLTAFGACFVCEYVGGKGKGTYHKQCRALTATFKHNIWRSPHIIMKYLSKQVTQNDGRPELVGSVVKPRPNVAVFVGRTDLPHVTHRQQQRQRHRHRYMYVHVSLSGCCLSKLYVRFCYCFLNAEVQRMRSVKVCVSESLMQILPRVADVC